MNESESKNEKPKEERRFDPELLKKGLRCDLDQYDMLKRCSEKKDITEWNKWRIKNPDEKIWLEGACLEYANLKEADLGHAELTYVSLGSADLSKANLKDVDLSHANLERVNLDEAHLENAELKYAHLEGARFWKAHLSHGHLWRARLKSAYLGEASIEHTDLTDADLRGANIWRVNLAGAKCKTVIVDGSTLLWKCKIDLNTDFNAVGLDSARIDAATKQLLEYNIRRKNWEDWYNGQHWSLRWLVRKFWEISDYGISTKRIIKTFFEWALVFALFYYAWGFIDYYLVGIKDYPGIVSDLFVLEDNQQALSCWLVPFRAVYFSIVTMTTLGFGDMYANAHSFLRGLFGHALLALQVILGYVLLGALVTRFAVLFTAGGPAGKFASEKEKKEG